MNYTMEDTIAAPASGMTKAGIGIIRISGSDALKIADSIFVTGSGKKISDFKPNSIRHGYITDKNNEKKDEVMVSYLKGPHSYTGEDTIEINCHGGIYLINRIMEIVTAAGARPAEPGEFTRRAFLNGRIDLSEAEAVMDVIGSNNERALKNSLGQLSGKLKHKIINIRKAVLYEIAHIESALDDPEHFDLTGYPEELKQKLISYIRDIDNMKESYHNGRIMQEGARTAILGKPNAGKSSLLNMLSGYERAIVTDIAGTTRDSIEESVSLGNVQLRLIDTAGIRETEDKVERIGIERAEAAAKNADLIFFVFDSSLAIDDDDRMIADLINKMSDGQNVIAILNKNDLDAVTTPEHIKLLFNNHKIPIISISAKTGEGTDKLKAAVEDFFINDNNSENEDVIITNVRHRNELEMAGKSLENVIESIDMGMAEDFFSIDLNAAYEHLGYIIGEEIGDDLVEEIFSKFCMGK